MGKKNSGNEFKKKEIKKLKLIMEMKRKMWESGEGHGHICITLYIKKNNLFHCFIFYFLNIN